MSSIERARLQVLVCPRCNSEHRPGTLKCGCGHQFAPVQEYPLWTTDCDPQIAERGFFSFRSFITPMLVRIIYILGVLGLTGASGFIAFMPAERLFATSLLPPRVMPIAVAALVFLVGNLVWRILCEIAMIPFSLHTALLAVHRRLKKRP